MVTVGFAPNPLRRQVLEAGAGPLLHLCTQLYQWSIFMAELKRCDTAAQTLSPAMTTPAAVAEQSSAAMATAAHAASNFGPAEVGGGAEVIGLDADSCSDPDAHPCPEVDAHTKTEKLAPQSQSSDAIQSAPQQSWEWATLPSESGKWDWATHSTFSLGGQDAWECDMWV